ncbi:hypothetical protein DTO212C5_5866 [Paecilomyces variotii]|nr:hypothetical protein DTO212C5_5866 [Paecilomyces variotii]
MNTVQKECTFARARATKDSHPRTRSVNYYYFKPPRSFFLFFFSSFFFAHPGRRRWSRDGHPTRKLPRFS